MNGKKVIKQRNKKMTKYNQFHQEIKESQDDDTNKYGFKKLDSNSSINNKTIHKGSSKNVILKMNEIINDFPEKYYHQHLKSDWFKFLLNLIVSLLYIVIFFFYYNSLTACSKNLALNKCIEKIDINHYYKVYLLCFISANLISLILVLIITKFVSIYHSFFIILELVIFIIINHQNNIYKNGLFSFKILCFFIFVSFLFLLFFIFFLIKLGKKMYFYSVIFFFAVL